MAYEHYPAGSYPPAGGYGAPAPYAAGYGAPQPYSYGPPQSYPSEELRTIFITGFPADVKERELNNLLRFLHGYEASQMNWKNGQAQGFAMFTNSASARAACDAVAQLCFDEASVLRCELARKNMYIKEDPSIKRARSGPPGAGGPPGGYGAPAAGGPRPGGSSYRPVGYVPITNTGDNPPCNTLFIGNLGDSTDEAELHSLFAVQPGFRQLKMVHGAKAATCFVEFADLPSAMAAHQSQQGAVLASCDRGGLRIQYSKNPFGRKRDFAELTTGRSGDDYGHAAFGYGSGGGGAPGGAGGKEYAPAEYHPEPAAPGV